MPRKLSSHSPGQKPRDSHWDSTSQCKSVSQFSLTAPPEAFTSLPSVNAGKPHTVNLQRPAAGEGHQVSPAGPLRGRGPALWAEQDRLVPQQPRSPYAWLLPPPDSSDQYVHPLSSLHIGPHLSSTLAAPSSLPHHRAGTGLSPEPFTRSLGPWGPPRYSLISDISTWGFKDQLSDASNLQ